MKRKKNSPGDYTFVAETTLNGKPTKGIFRIQRDEEADKIQGRCLWPITGNVGGIDISIRMGRRKAMLVIDAGSWLRESVDILENIVGDGFKTVKGIPEPKGGIGCYS